MKRAQYLRRAKVQADIDALSDFLARSEHTPSWQRREKPVRQELAELEAFAATFTEGD